jgi:hypothetical protein
MAVSNLYAPSIYFIQRSKKERRKKDGVKEIENINANVITNVKTS